MQTKLFSTLCSIEHLTKAWQDVKGKKAGGGIDGQTLATFEINLKKNLQAIRQELLQGKWEPYPYLRIEIPKKVTQKRQIGMLTVKDKIVQQAIRLLFEPSCEKMFLPCSYGYRPGKGAVAAIHRVHHLCTDKRNAFLLRLDIDDYFNHIDHERLERLIRGITQETEIIRLIMLCVKMGAVSKNLSWCESEEGLHQGAVLSPCLANLYLHGFDMFVTGMTKSYVRYADDFVIFCASREQAEEFLIQTQRFLTEKLHLSLNPPHISAVSDGFEFLGIQLNDKTITLAPKKRDSILVSISEFELTSRGLVKQAAKKWDGIVAYYGKLLSQEELQELDQALYSVLEEVINVNRKRFPSRIALSYALSDIHFLTRVFKEQEAAIKETLLDSYSEGKRTSPEIEAKEENRRVVLKRKHEYRKLEEEHAELVLARPGMALGLSGYRVTVKEKGLVVASVPTSSLKHISVLGSGVSISSNILKYLLESKIPLDIFGSEGKHIGSFLSASSFQCQRWQQQADCPLGRRNRLGSSIIEGKLTNQLNLLKYFHKYHKAKRKEYQMLLEEMEVHVRAYKDTMRPFASDSPEFMKTVLAFESQGALKYWAYVKAMLADDEVGFEGRIKQGAKDRVNSMLNYGYAILYARVWQALLRAQLNPYDSIIHIRQAGKPTFVYDVVELFRAQAVDRVVLSLVQKKEPVDVEGGLLTDEGKKLLVRNITERLQKREKYRGEEMSLEQIIYRQAREMADYITDGTRYLPYKAKW